MFEARKVAGSAKFKQSETVWNKESGLFSQNIF